MRLREVASASYVPHSWSVFPFWGTLLQPIIFLIRHCFFGASGGGGGSGAGDRGDARDGGGVRAAGIVTKTVLKVNKGTC